MRALAVVAVVLFHANAPIVHGGFIGVDMFFVISGFLITDRLAAELTANGRIDFAAFYARRARRILPAAFAVIVLTVVAAMAVRPPLLLPNTFRDAAASALYVPNIVFARIETDYFRPKADQSVFEHYWSLGIEEQFYLLWPLAMLVAFVYIKYPAGSMPAC